MQIYNCWIIKLSDVNLIKNIIKDKYRLEMTTASSHLSKQLKQFIKSIGQTKSKQQQDKIIVNELQSLKPNLAEKNITPKKLKEYLIRALYIQMLGHSAPFAHIHAINLTQNKSLILKRIGYLMCSLFFTKDSELLIMLVSTILKDLNSQDVHQVVICLTALGNIMSNTIASGIIEAVLKLTNHATDLVRKKALLILQKIKNQTEIQVPDFKEKLKKGLCDKEPSVMAATLNLYYDQIKQNPRKYRQLASSFVIILKQVIEHKLPKQFDYHRMPAPWIQMKLMKILQLLGKGDVKASEHCYTILEQAMKRADQTNNSISFAIAYQCIKTIFTIYPNVKLVEQAAAGLSKFLSNTSNNNLKHMGLRLLSQAHKDHPKLLDDYQLIIVECLQSKDQTLKQETLDLLYRMTTNENIEIIVSKMLDALHGSTDSHFRNALVLKITQLCQRFSPTHKWYLETMEILFQLGSQYLTPNILNNFLKLVVQNYEQSREFGEQIIKKMKGLLQKSVPTDFTIKVAVWIIGEIGSNFYAGNSQKLQEIYKSVYKCFDFDIQFTQTKNWIIDAIVKLSSTNGFVSHSNVKVILDTYISSSSITTYQRSLQSKKLAKYNAALKKSYQVNFDEDMSFLDGFVQNSKLNGAKQYRKIKSKQSIENEIRFTPYEQKSPSQSFPFGNSGEVKKQSSPKKTQEKTGSKPPVVVIPPSRPEQKQKKKLITPQQKLKMAKAKQIFGVPTTKQVKPKPVIKGPESKRQPPKSNKVQTSIDLI